MISFRRYFKLGDLSYKELGKRVVVKVSEDSCTMYAAAMAYCLLFALFPFFLFLTTLIDRAHHYHWCGNKCSRGTFI